MSRGRSSRRRFQHTAARRRLAFVQTAYLSDIDVSTHSRPKAAGAESIKAVSQVTGFNTQPPEGGWFIFLIIMGISPSFNTQPPEGGWERYRHLGDGLCVSTHSRPKAAGASQWRFDRAFEFQHTAARRRLDIETMRPSPRSRFQHTAARRRLGGNGRYGCLPSCFNTQPPEGGWF